MSKDQKNARSTGLGTSGIRRLWPQGLSGVPLYISVRLRFHLISSYQVIGCIIIVSNSILTLDSSNIFEHFLFHAFWRNAGAFLCLSGLHCFLSFALLLRLRVTRVMLASLRLPMNSLRQWLMTSLTWRWAAFGVLLTILLSSYMLWFAYLTISYPSPFAIWFHLIPAVRFDDFHMPHSPACPDLQVLDQILPRLKPSINNNQHKVATTS